MEAIRPDRIDSELIEDTLRTPGYALIAVRLREEIGRRTRSLIDSGQEADKTRGFILGLETALAVPKIIADEGRLKKNGKR